MKNKKNFWGILALVLVLGLIVVGCDNGSDDETGKYGPDTINGVWYRVTGDYGTGGKTGTVITISNGEGILTSVDDEKYNDTGNYVCHYANYVSRGLINIGDVVFRNIVYTGYIENNKCHYWSYDIWYRDGAVGGTLHDGGGTPDWLNGLTLAYTTKDSSYPDRLRAGNNSKGNNSTYWPLHFRK